MDQQNHKVFVNGYFLIKTIIFSLMTFVFVLLGMYVAALPCGIIAFIAAFCTCFNSRFPANGIMMSAEAQLLQGNQQEYLQGANQGNHYYPTHYGTCNHSSTSGFNRGLTTVESSMSLGVPWTVSQASRNSTYDDPPTYSSLDPPDDSWLNPLRMIEASDVYPSHQDQGLRDSRSSDPPSYEAATTPRDVTSDSLVE